MGMNILSDGLILYNNAFAASPSKDKIMNAKPIIIGVAGGSGSGKTTVSRALYERFSGHPITIIEQDYYYNDQAHLSPEVRRAQNYDHTDAFDNALLYQQLGQLLERVDAAEAEVIGADVEHRADVVRAVAETRADQAAARRLEHVRRVMALVDHAK